MPKRSSVSIRRIEGFIGGFTATFNPKYSRDVASTRAIADRCRGDVSSSLRIAFLRYQVSDQADPPLRAGPPDGPPSTAYPFRPPPAALTLSSAKGPRDPSSSIPPSLPVGTRLTARSTTDGRGFLV
ncbi:MAG TPA: hypothetical protein PK177_19720, partial [Burkholderiaceae bacterium]|nr:hypothetical protein [Burkholderiaceae bacterium]